LPASFPFHPGHPIAACIVVLDRPAAWAALVVLDAGHPYAVHFPASFREPVHDCPSATGEQCRLALQRARRGRQPQDVQEL